MSGQVKYYVNCVCGTSIGCPMPGMPHPSTGRVETHVDCLQCGRRVPTSKGHYLTPPKHAKHETEYDLLEVQ